MATYTDNFNRADANPLDGSWAKPTGVTLNFALTSNAVGGVTSSGARLVYNTGTVGAKQYSQATCTTIGDGDIGVACRIQSGSFSGYSFANRTVANGGWLLERYDSGSPTIIASNAALGGAANDVIRIEANGSTITVYVNGSVALTATDATYSTGSAGLWCFNTTSRLDDWSGGDIGPTITAQPTSQTVNNGATATFSVTATGAAPITYQWRKNGSNIGGATSSSYTTPAVSYSDQAASFDCVVTDANGTATSTAAALLVAYNLSGTGPRAYPVGPWSTGPAFTFLRAPVVSGGTTIPTITGDATAAGITALINQARVIAGIVGNAAAAGITAAINQARVIQTTTGDAAAGGVTAVINQARTIATTVGDAAAAGATARIDQQRTIAAGPGGATAAGTTALIDQQRAIQTTVGNATAAGVTATVSGSVTIVTTPATAAADGVPARIDQQRVIGAGPGNAVADGATARIDQQRSVAAGPGNAAADGVPATINAARTITTTVGNAVAAGVTAAVNTSTTIQTSPGNAVASGVTALIVVSLEPTTAAVADIGGPDPDNVRRLKGYDADLTDDELMNMAALLVTSGILETDAWAR